MHNLKGMLEALKKVNDLVCRALKTNDILKGHIITKQSNKMAKDDMNPIDKMKFALTSPGSLVINTSLSSRISIQTSLIFIITNVDMILITTKQTSEPKERRKF